MHQQLHVFDSHSSMKLFCIAAAGAAERSILGPQLSIERAVSV